MVDKAVAEKEAKQLAAQAHVDDLVQKVRTVVRAR